MLIQFTLENIRSFRDRATFSLLSSALSSRSPELAGAVFSPKPDLALLTSAAIYGANASGKSNLVTALSFMRWFVMNSVRALEADAPIPVDLFRLAEPPHPTTATLEVVFLLAGVEYRYGFELGERHVVAEWLHARTSQREKTLFTRQHGKFKLGAEFRREGHGLADKTRHNALFLTVAAQFGGPVSCQVVQWFKAIRLMSGLDDESPRTHTIAGLRDPARRQRTLDLLHKFDLDIEDLELIKHPLADGQETVKTIRRTRDAAGAPGRAVRFDLADESQGTQKIFALTGPLLDVLDGPGGPGGGGLMVLDEFDARLHPLLSRTILRQFNTPAANPHHAQLIITTHDTTLLNKETLRRDQIWFTEKDTSAGTHLFSLAELKVRNDASFDKDYATGRYGAIPFLRAPFPQAPLPQDPRNSRRPPAEPRAPHASPRAPKQPTRP